MKDLAIKIGIAILGVLFTKIMITKVLANTQKKKQFTSEYLKILNNPEFKVKRSCE